MTSPRREKTAPVGQEAAFGVTTQPLNSTATDATLSGLSDRLQETDPLQGWYGLAAGVKQSKLRQMKRGGQRKGGRS